MKVDMMVVGLRVVTDDVMEIELVPLEVAKRKTNIMDLVGGDAGSVLKAFQSEQQKRSKVYVSRVWCSENNIVPLMSMTLELLPADKKRIRDTYVGK